MTNKINLTHLNEKWSSHYISFGKTIKLPSSEKIFQPSPAGVFFWEILYRNFSEKFKSYENVLDLGCESGFISIALAISGCRNITASDINPDHVDYAKNQFDKHDTKHTQSKFICSNLFDSLGDDKYDLEPLTRPLNEP